MLNKKIIVSVLATAAVLSFSGCAKNDAPPSTAASNVVNAAENNKINDVKLAPSEDAELAPNQFGTLCSELTGTITFSLDKAPENAGVDVSMDELGTVIAVIDGEDAVIYGRDGNGVKGSFAKWLFRRFKAKTIDLTGLDTSDAPNMEGMFQSCKSEKIILSNVDTSNAKTMRAMFQNCCATELDLSNFNTDNVTSMELMFENCAVSKLDLSNFNMENVTDIKDMFYMCTVDSEITCRAESDKEVFMNPETKHKDLSFVVK